VYRRTAGGGRGEEREAEFDRERSLKVKILITVAIVAAALAACGRNAPEHSPAQMDTDAVAETPGVLGADSGLTGRLVGDWELQSVPPQQMPGIRVSFSVDSCRGTEYFGRVTNYFSGNVGRNPSEFEAFSDSLRDDEFVRFLLHPVENGWLGGAIEGRLGTDTILVNSFVLGPDTLTNIPRRWMLVRSR